VGLSYRKSFKAGPVRITASRSGISHSAGVKGARVTKRADGRVQAILSAPGTGLRYTTTTSSGKRKVAGRREAASSPAVADSASLPGRRSTALPYPPPAGTPPLVFKGYLAKVTLRPDRIQIDRRVMGRVNGNHSATISWQHLAGVDFLDPSRLINGHVHFAPAGDPRGLTATGGGNRMAAAARNPHAIMFTWQQRAAYERLRDLLTANQVAGTRPAPPAPSIAAVARPILSPQPAGSPPQASSALAPPPNQEPVWLPGNVDVQVAGEAFHSTAIKEVCRSRRPGVPDVAVLVPEPGNPYDHNAIAVHVNRFQVGYLPRQVTAAAKPALTAFMARTGRHVACPARIMWHEINSRSVAQIILSLDPAPLGLGSEAFGHLPDLDRVLQQHLSRLDTAAAPAMTGCDPAARGPRSSTGSARSSHCWNKPVIRFSPTPGPAWPVASGTRKVAAMTGSPPPSPRCAVTGRTRPPGPSLLTLPRPPRMSRPCSTFSPACLPPAARRYLQC